MTKKSERLKYLADIQEYLNNQNYVNNLFIPNIELVMEMIQKNIFRPLPVVKKQGVVGEMIGVEEEELILDPSWNHLQPVYEIFMQFIINEAIEMRLLKNFITQKFVQEFLQLFDSEEPKEREYLKNILHRLYSKLVPRRKMIRKIITDTFQTLIHERYKFNGISELLDILASIISGFAVPLREEHIHFFKKVLVPLHKVQTSIYFHIELIRCSMLFLSKDPSLATTLVEGLLKYWPFANNLKELAYLNELLDVIEVCSEMHNIEPLIEPIFIRVIKCITSSHLQIADKVMCFFENPSFNTLLKTYKEVAIPTFVPVVNILSQNHWHKLIQESLIALSGILQNIDKDLYDRCLKAPDPKFLYLTKSPNELKEERKQPEKIWSDIIS